MAIVARTNSLASLTLPAGLDRFAPLLPKSLAETGLNAVMLEDLIFKLLLGAGAQTGSRISETLCLPFELVVPLLYDLKNRILLAHQSTAGLNDFHYMLTDQGRERALMAREVSAYCGPAPVPFEDYLRGVSAQSIQKERPGPQQLTRAFADLLLASEVLDILGPAVNSARGLFLYGESGNGKTSIAERISRCFRQDVFIPRAVWVDGQILQLYDGQNHIPVPEAESPIPRGVVDPRWVEIRRPVVMVGGELTMDALEITYNETLRISEAPLQMKANGGVFLIDDFGRQRINPTDLLNRWIVPLEKRVDFLTLPNGKKIEVPFDELIIFSTNLNPRDLADEAFLRRIPYKVNIHSPSEEQFKALFARMAERADIPYEPEALEHLISKHYRGKREFRACQPRDLLDQIRNACAYSGAELRATPELLDAACRNYFAAMGVE